MLSPEDYQLEAARDAWTPRRWGGDRPVDVVADPRTVEELERQEFYRQQDNRTDRFGRS
jgi:hypothetical protein